MGAKADLPGNARFPLGPQPALTRMSQQVSGELWPGRFADLRRWGRFRGNVTQWRLRPGTEWFVTGRAQRLVESEVGWTSTASDFECLERRLSVRAERVPGSIRITEIEIFARSSNRGEDPQMTHRAMDVQGTLPRIGWIISFLLIGLALPDPAHAQTVQGRVLASGSGLPLEGVLIFLHDDTGRQQGGYLTNDSGRFLIRAPGPGRYTLHAERIGFETVTSEPFDLALDQVFQIRLEAAEEPIQLAGLRVEGRRRCVVRPGEGQILTQIWDEARKALRVQAWTEQEDLIRFLVVGFERELDIQSRLVVSENQQVSRWVTRNPIKSLPAESLITEGFIRSDEGSGFHYFGPDATVLLSDLFLDTHCFRLEEDESNAEMVGLSFEPIRGRTIPDIEGTLWLDRETARLQFLEFAYSWSPWAEATGVAGGRVQFEELPNGAWIIRSWWIRMPRMVRDFGLMAGGG
jgi:hypothetical protein